MEEKQIRPHKFLFFKKTNRREIQNGFSKTKKKTFQIKRNWRILLFFKRKKKKKKGFESPRGHFLGYNIELKKRKRKV
jgi:hypothetical protein